MKVFKFCYNNFLILIFFYALVSCSNGYIKARTISTVADFPGTIEKAKKDNRSFIFHSGINMYSITSYQLDQAKENITVHLNRVDSLHIVQVENLDINKPKYKKGDLPAVNEIHVYSKDSVSYTLDEPHTIPFGKIANIDLIGKG